MESIKILIVDHLILIREGLAKMIEQVPEFEVVEQAGDARESVQKTLQFKPQVVLMDSDLKGLNGFEATCMIKKESPSTEVIILSDREDPEYVVRAVKAGAAGFVFKNASFEELIKAIKTVNSGGSFIQPTLTRQVLKDLTLPSDKQKETHPHLLSQRELEVLQYIAQGKTNKEIGKQLFISEKTVKAHLRAIFKKLKVTDRTEAVAYAMREGWIE